VLTNLVFFLLLVYAAGVLRKQPALGVAAAFLLLSIPLFVYT